MAGFMAMKAVNARLKQNQIAKEEGCSSSTSQRYGNDIKMLSTCRIPPRSHKRKQKHYKLKQKIERPQLTSDDLK